MRINHNLMAMNSERNLGINSDMQAKSIEKLSSGLRINRAGDDAAGLAISEKMRGQIRGLNQASQNGQNAISMIQTAEGALNETHSILQRMRELAVQGASDTNVAADRTAIASEITQLNAEVDRIANTTEFNTKKLLNGSISTGTVAKTQSFSVNSTSLLNSAAGIITSTTAVVGLEDGSGNNLGIVSTDIIIVKGQINGTTYSSSITVSTATSITDIQNLIVANFAAGGASATVTAGAFQVSTNTGLSNAIFGLSITATDANGVQRIAFNNAFGNLAQTQAAANAATNSVATVLIGANANQTMNVDVNDMRAAALGLSGVSVTSASSSQTSVTVVDAAIATVSTERAKLGAFQNRLEHTITNLNTSSENLQASESRIRDVDMAKEMMNSTKANILAQAAQAMLAQANQAPQGALQLLR